ncbi:hypothetical protein ACFL1H_02385 [Nanoarchaeota archaeon]
MKIRNNIQKLTMLYSPYYIQFSDKVSKALSYALKKDLMEEYDVDLTLITDFINHQKEIPIWILEAACNINIKYREIPASYQYLWFCLHGTKLKRSQPSGRIFYIKVNFTSCYLHLDEKLKYFLLKALKSIQLPLYKFCGLCGYHKGEWLNTKVIPLIVILKICQILSINIWNIIKGKELFSKTRKHGKIIIPINFFETEIVSLLIWLRTEGHLELASTHIEINQKNDIDSLKKIYSLFLKKFRLGDNVKKFPKGKRGEDRLIISSSPLRQLLCLKYDIPPGYKSGSLKPMILNNYLIKDYLKIIPAFIQSDGCLSYQYTRNKKKKLPRFEFAVRDMALAIDCFIVIKKLGYNPTFGLQRSRNKQKLYKVGLYNSKQVIDLVNKSKKYFFNNNKIEYLKMVCTDGIGL